MNGALPTVVIADDHRIVTAGLIRLLSDRYEILETINDGRLVPDAVCRLQPDVVLLDLSMPNISGLEALRQIRLRGVHTKAIMLTMHADAALAVETLKAGAAGFVLKESSGDELLAALDVVLSGGTYLASDLTKDIVNLMVGVSDPNRVELTAQQREVLRMIVRGQRAKEIANVLDLSPRSVDGIKYRIMQQLDLHSTAELVRYAVENRLVAF
jgi:DNA-binding NarL/FixJ family response regulator